MKNATSSASPPSSAAAAAAGLSFGMVMEEVVTPLTVLLGLLGNGLSICVLMNREIQLRKSFSRILVALAVFDTVFLLATCAIFSLT